MTIQNVLQNQLNPERLQGIDFTASMPIILAVSGGTDSLAMAYMFRHSGLKNPIKVVHIEHGLRPGSVENSEKVKAIIEKWGWTVTIIKVDVPALVKNHGWTTEEAARKGRYTALAGYAQEIGSRLIGLGHQANDQAETVLLNLVRGTGTQGLGGMSMFSRLSKNHLLPDFELSSSILLFRPLLRLTRKQLETYCKEHGLTPLQDETNEEIQYRRNQVRHELLPQLEKINPNIIQTLNRTADILTEDYAYIQSQAQHDWSQIVTEESERAIQFKRSFASYLPAIQRALIRLAVKKVTGKQDFGWVHLDAVLNILMNWETGKYIQLPDRLIVELGYDTFSIRVGSATDEDTTIPRIINPLRVGLDQWVALQGQWKLMITAYEGQHEGIEWDALISNPWITPLNGDRLTFPLTLRGRKKGERFYPQGTEGSQTISKFMSNVKIEGRWRDQWPLLTTDTDIIWVVGHRMDERYLVTPDTKKVYLARLERIEE